MEQKAKIKISIIIPIYNMEKYLKQCLDSVISQNLKEIEILCVNDGSTDDSEKIILDYKEKDNRIVLISQSNKGVAAARNIALKNARGEYVAFMDPDDWYPDADVLRILYDKALESGLMIIGGSFGEWTEGRLVTSFKGLKKKYAFEKDEIVSYRNYQFDYGYHRFIYHLQFLKDNDIFFPPYIRFQDPPFFVKAMAIAGTFYAVRKVTYCYRVGTQKIVWTEQKLIDLLRGLRDILVITSQYHLKELHCITLQRLGENYADMCAKALPTASPEMISALIDIEKSIDLSLVKDEKLKEYREFFYYILHKEFDNLTKTVGTSICKRISYTNEESQQNKKSSAPYNQIVTITKRNKPLVSVIIPVYNVENYIVDCIQSVCQQSLKDIEIIIVNDGTPDNSMEKIANIISSDQRIRVIEKENGGLSSARNAGLKIATGEYILFLDSDDTLFEDALHLLYSLAKEMDLDDLFYNAEVFYDSEKVQEEQKNFASYYKRNGVYFGTMSGPDLFSRFIKYNDFKPSACLQFLKHSFLSNNNISFYEGILHEDNLFTMYCLLKAKRVSFFDEELYRRRVHNDSIMTVPKSIKNTYGYYISIIYMIKAIEEETDILSKRYIEALKEYLSAMTDTAANFIKGTSSIDISEFLMSLPFQDQIAFEIFIRKIASLKYEISDLKVIERKKDKVSANLLNTINAKKKDILTSEKKYKELEEQYNQIANSFSYKIGQLITYIPRMIFNRLK